MLAFSSKTTTFLAYLTLILAAAAVEAHESPLQQRDHLQLKRIIKKRAPQIDFIPDLDGAGGVAPIPSAESLSASPSDSGAPSSAVESLASSASVPVSESAGISASASVSESESASVSASESASASAAPSSTSQEAAQITSEPAGPIFTERSTSTRAASTRIVTTSIDAEPSSPPSMAGAAQADQNKSNIITILIAVVASIGGVFILWTIFRKWKLGSSKKFDKRLQPIDWEKHNDGDVGGHRRLSDSSFQSAGHGNTRSPNGLNPIPDHDFTAGPVHLSPVGGYADMARGPSPSFGRNGSRY